MAQEILENLQDSNLTIQAKLKVIRLVIQKWNVEQNGICEKKIKIMGEFIKKADEIGDITQENIIQDDLRDKYMELDSILEQKSRISWLQEGNTNTKNFMQRR